MSANFKHQLQVEPYTHISVNENSALLYNTLTGEKLEYNESLRIVGLIKKLNQKENLQMVCLTEKEINEPEISEFITDLRNCFMGDIIKVKNGDNNFFQFVPMLNIQKDINHLKNDRSVGENLKNYLMDITIYLNGNCSQCCSFCSIAHNQLCCCTKNGSKEIEPSQVDAIIAENIMGLKRLNFCGGNLLKYSHLKSLASVLNKHMFKASFFVQIENFINDFRKFPDFVNDLCEIKLLVPPDTEKSQMEKLMDTIQQSGLSAALHFIVEKDADVDFIENLKLEESVNYELLALYSNGNRKFFRENIYIDKEDIFQDVKSHRDIFRNMSMNINYFGKAIVRNNGDVFFGNTSIAAGNINQASLSEMLYEEFKSGNCSWFKIRNEAPCTGCLYQYLCPSPSNYEAAIGKNNLCYIMQKNS